MRIARNVDEACPRCGNDRNVWMFEKPEATITKECYSCESCGLEWTEVKD